jgi:diguanylate cyclase (GGDEF)-like protein/PAS domain S-box-containing protein
MNITYKFLASMVDTLTEHIAVINRHGKILYVNQSWRLFGTENGHTDTDQWIGKNYLSVCDASENTGEPIGSEAAKGIRSVINGERESYYLEYPCDSPTSKRWFLMRAVSFSVERENYVVISHSNITERKLIEEQVVHLSRLDSLTGLANRRYFEEWFENAWARSSRDNSPITMALIDIDHFKTLNDTFGHHAGDKCLQLISQELLSLTRRPDDIGVRYGGDELMLVYRNTAVSLAEDQINNLTQRVKSLAIPNPKAATQPTVTLSIGVVSDYPERGNDRIEMIKLADSLLYTAKDSGRNCIKFNRTEN